MNAPAIEPHIIRCCGDCAGILLALPDVRRSSIPSIGLGHLCEVHTGELVPQATSILEALGDPAELAEVIAASQLAPALARVARETAEVAAWPSGLAVSPADGQVPPPRGEIIGPETFIATRLLVAWTTADKGVNADDTTIAFAADVARKLLARTGGR